MTNVILPPLVIEMVVVVATFLVAETDIAVTMPRAAETGIVADIGMASPAVAITVMNLPADDMGDITTAATTAGTPKSLGVAVAKAATASGLADTIAMVDAMLITGTAMLADAVMVSRAVIGTDTASTSLRGPAAAATDILTAMPTTDMVTRAANGIRIATHNDGYSSC